MSCPNPYLPTLHLPLDARTARLHARSQGLALLLALSGVTGCVESWKGVDGDGDGWSAADGDCWDTEAGPEGSGLSGADIYPGADEVWYDGIDANCDGVDDFDPDGDGWVKEEDHVGRATVGIAGSGANHLGAGDCYNTPDDDFALDPLAGLDAASVDPATVYPGADDAWYDGIDQDCDQRDDYDADEDGDRSLADGDGTDCDDNDSRRAGIFDELCDPDGIDEDCDGLINGEDDSVDPGTAFEAFADIDGDGFGDSDTLDVVCDLPDGFVANADDCDDTRSDVNPDAPEVCDADNVDENCNGVADDDDNPANIEYAATDVAWSDADGDNYGAGAAINICDPTDDLALNDEDCDDTNADINPSVAEICDEGIDNNCDGLADDAAPDVDLSTGTEFYADTDGDGYGDAGNATRTCAVTSGYVADATDCDDSTSAVNPGATEVCNSIDDDCDNDIDDADASVSYGASDVWWADTDGDNYGDSSSTTSACTAPANHVDPDTRPDDDCDDDNSAINPGASEICDPADVDEDCDGSADDADSSVLSAGKTTFYNDGDGDGFGDIGSTLSRCDVPSGYVSDNTDCDDGDGSINPDATEVCDAGDVDEDCDELVNDDDPSIDTSTQSTFYADSDGDTYGDPLSTELACDTPAGFVTNDSDCDDDNDAVKPGATEVCNGIDDDCDDDIDDADSSLDTSTQTTWYLDADGDDYGVSSTTLDACDLPSGYAEIDGDCDDGVDTTNPGATEVCNNNADDDCDSTTVCELASGAVSGAAQVAWAGEGGDDNLGYSVAMVPDVTDDGIADIILSAHKSDGLSGSSLSNVGSVYIAGSLDGMTVDDTETGTVRFDTQIVGESAAHRLGLGVTAGDYNNDGYNDLIVGAVLADTGPGDTLTYGGESYLFAGPITAATLEVASGDFDDAIVGGATNDNLGFAAATGDIDGDAFADVAVSAPQCQESNTIVSTGSDAGNGEIHVLHGGSGSWFDKSLSTSTGIEFLGESKGDCAGFALVFADINGTGQDELIIGAPSQAASGNFKGEVYIADTAQSGSISLASETSVRGSTNGERVGTAVGTADVNNDGYADVLIGGTGVNAYDGVVYVFYGGLGATIGSASTVTAASTAADATIQAPSGSAAQLGQSVAGAGDMNNDGVDDIVIGAWRDESSGSKTGAAWVVHGPITGSVTLDSSTQVRFTGESNLDAFGASVAGGYDVNGDGDFSDIVLGAFNANSEAGAAYVVFGEGE